MVGELIAAAGLGLGLGVVTGLPLGIVNVAIVEAATRHGLRPAAGLGTGGALADGVHAAIAFGGVGHALATRPGLASTLSLVSGAVLLAYAILLLRPRAAVAAVHDRRTGFARGVAAGLGLTLPNPAALGAWVAVAAALSPATPAAAAAIAAGVAVGSAAWFVTLARLAAQGAVAHAAPRRWVTRAAALVLGAVGVAAVVRGLLRW